MKKLLFLFITGFMALASQTYANVATDNALFKGVSPLREAMGKPIFANRIVEPGYHCWDPSLIKVGNMYHLVYSRWPVVDGDITDISNWISSGEIRHASSPNLLGPYTNAETVITAANNNGWSAVNSKITPEYNPDGSIKRYMLYFINVRLFNDQGQVNKTRWFYSNDMSNGSWTPGSVNQAEAPFNNPAMLLYPDGSAYALCKYNDPAYAAEEHGSGRHLIAYTSTNYTANAGDLTARWGSPLANSRGTINQLPENMNHEDSDLWEMGSNYHAIMTDMDGLASGLHKAVLQWYSPTNSGIDYQLYSDTPIWYLHTPVAFQEGNAKRFSRMERPAVYKNRATGKVEAVLMACSPSSTAETEGSAIIIWPVDEWEESSATPDTKLLLHYKFDELSGTSTADASGNGNTGTVITPNWEPTAGRTQQYQGALDLTTSSVDVPTALFTNIHNQVTITFWTKDIAGTPWTSGRAFDAWTSDNIRELSVELPDSGSVTWSAGHLITHQSLNTVQETSTSLNLTSDLSGWVHWAFVKDAVTGIQTIYRDGYEIKHTAGNNFIMHDVASFAIGRSLEAGKNETLPALIDDFKIFGRALTAAEVLADLADGNNIPPKAIASATPGAGVAPLAVTLDASASFDSDGTIATYEWDVNSDGTYEYNTTNPTQQHSFTADAVYQVTLRVTDDSGDSRNATTQVIVGEGNLTTGLVAHWKLDETTVSGVAADSSSNGFDGTYHGAISDTNIITGAAGNALEMDGVDDYIDAAITMDSPEEFSVSFRLKPSHLTNYNQLLAANGTGWGAFTFSAAANGACYVGISANPVARFAPLPTGTLILDEWHLYTFTYNNGEGTFYRDTTELGRENWASIPTTDWSTFNIGSDDDDTILGGIDDVRIYNRALTADDIAYLSVATNSLSGGSNIPPIPSATMTPNQGPLPLLVTMDASGSSDTDGTIVSYEWDINGDGTYEYTSTNATQQHTFTTQGIYQVILRVTDDNGAVRTDSAQVIAGNGDITTDLVAHWKFDETTVSSGIVADSSGNGFDGTYNGSMTDANIIAGPLGNALEMDGIDDHITAPINMTSPGAFTVSFRLNPSQLSNYNQSISANIEDWGAFRFQAAGGGASYCGITPNGASRFSPLAAGTLIANQWHLYTFTYDNGNASFYRDATELDSEVWSGFPVPTTTWTNFYIGMNGSNTIKGGIDDVRIYSRALTASDVALLSVATNAPVSTVTLDSDNDGLNDFLEVAFGLDKDDGTDVPVPFSLDANGNIDYKVLNKKTGYTYQIQTNSSLTGTWGDFGAPIIGSDTSTGTSEKIDQSLIGVDGKLFIRIQVSD